MGIKILSNCDCSKATGNPKADNFEIIDYILFKEHTLLKVKYPDCANYEGIKIIVLGKSLSEEDIKKLTRLDPHFCNTCGLSPIARFVPSDYGWRMAIAFIMFIGG